MGGVLDLQYMEHKAAVKTQNRHVEVAAQVSLRAACRGLAFVAGLLWGRFRGPNLYVLITTYQSLITAYNKLITDKLRASQAYKSLAKS